ncbi:hypothetical protein NQ314_009336 [Rhamnusium bicolor]|uniref:DDE Tnp4 domain-containing protein n=1 Tax=Rhamnusium bicolor TaxID=1586634 RepID=A0AAV8Y0W6_9CUCU|nr:hypothetical protein NQ314_009336 [Rhamnusium bicolor]
MPPNWYVLMASVAIIAIKRPNRSCHKNASGGVFGGNFGILGYAKDFWIKDTWGILIAYIMNIAVISATLAVSITEHLRGNTNLLLSTEELHPDIFERIINMQVFRMNSSEIPKVARFYEDVIPSYSFSTFKSRFRMTPTVFENVLHQIARHEMFRRCSCEFGGREQIPVEKILLITLWTLGTPESYRFIGDRFGVSKSTIFFCLHKTVKVIVNELYIYPLGLALCAPNYFITGDCAYPLQSWLITPFRNNGHLTHEQLHFNTTVSKTRVKVEDAFALLKGRFRRLKELLDMNEEQNIVDTIISCCVLHNICLMQGDEDVQQYINEDMERIDLINLDNYVPNEINHGGENLKNQLAQDLWNRRNRRRI